MKIRGIQSGAVLQRTAADLCEVLIEASFMGIPAVSMGELVPAGESLWQLKGIPTGGPYTITLRDDTESRQYDDVYVGDVWMLAGQSNMEGAGWLRDKDLAAAEVPNDAVRAFYMDDTWKPARPMLHQLWLSSDPAHRKTFEADAADVKSRGLHITDFPPLPQRRGVGPGCFFARTLYEKTGIPQGVIPCAVGGAPIHMWIPIEEGDNFYTAAARRLRDCGSRIRGIFWYQGEGYSASLDDYTVMFESMRQGFSAICQTRDLPAVVVQTFRCTIPSILHSDEAQYSWSRFRSHLLDMAHTLSNLAAVATNDLELDDCIHLSAAAQEKLGTRAADTMLWLTQNKGCAEPEIDTMEIRSHECVTEWSELRIRYRNLRGKLIAAGFPGGFMISQETALPSDGSIQHISLVENEVRIRFELTPDELRKRELWYGFGHHFHCTITDEGGHALPSVGPIPLGAL